jgi:Lon protease-like protein
MESPLTCGLVEVVAIMVELALFPLNTVLFPGMPISLHIFEERYKQMINRCLEEKLSFGVVLIEHGVEAHGPLARPHQVGCTAHITQMETLHQGRMNLIAVGETRFRVTHLYVNKYPYLTGDVDFVPLPEGDPQALLAGARHLRTWVGRYIEALGRPERLPFTVDQLPEDPLTFAYLAATLLQMPAVQKQPLLEATDAASLVDSLSGLYRREIALVRNLSQPPHADSDGNLFTAN